MYTIITAIAAITSLNINLVRSEDTPTIKSCLDLACPINDRNDSICTVADTSYKGDVLGFASIPAKESKLAELSWTEGVIMEDRDNGTNYHTNFYLGTPPDTNLTGTGACAVFFNKVSSEVTFGNASVQWSEGICEDAMGSQCVTALREHAEKLDVNGLGTSEACTKLEKDLNDNFDDICQVVAKSLLWSYLTVKGTVYSLLIEK